MSAGFYFQMFSERNHIHRESSKMCYLRVDRVLDLLMTSPSKHVNDLRLCIHVSATFVFDLVRKKMTDKVKGIKYLDIIHIICHNEIISSALHRRCLLLFF